MLMSVSCEADFLKVTCKLPLEAPPVACEPLGCGLFLVVDAVANGAVLRITASAPAPAPGLLGGRAATMCCVRAALGPEAPLPLPGSMAESLAAWGAPECGPAARTARHVSAAAVLPCAHVAELRAFAALVVVGTVVGPACVMGIPQAGLQAAAEAGADDMVPPMCALPPHARRMVSSP